MSYHLGANPGPGPTGPQPHDVPPNRRPLWAAAAAVVLVAALVTSAAAGGLRDDDPETASTDTTDDDESKETTTSSTSGDDTTTTGVDIGDVLGTELSIGNPHEPLPGHDWSPEVRDRFVSDCEADNASLQPTFETAGISLTDFCGCIYDEVSQSGLDFEVFEAHWEEPDPDSPARDALNQAGNGTCAAEVLGGLGG